MNSRNVWYTLLVVLGLLWLAVPKGKGTRGRELVNRNPEVLAYAGQIPCLLDCYRLETSDLLQVLRHGVILLNRSDRRYNPCPRFTLQGATASGRTMRLQVQQCPDRSVVTEIDLPADTTDCPCANQTNVP